MKVKVSIIKKMINEFLLKEETRLSQDSVDDQIDSILVRYEKDCIVDDDEFGSSFSEGLIDIKGTLFEAPGDDEETPEQDDEEVNDLTGDADKNEPDEPSAPRRPKIDISKFAGKISRFVTNQVNLLDIETVIVHRAFNYLLNNYGKAIANELVDVLESDYEIKYDRPSGEEPEEIPMARGAAASGLT